MFLLKRSAINKSGQKRDKYSCHHKLELSFTLENHWARNVHGFLLQNYLNGAIENLRNKEKPDDERLKSKSVLFGLKSRSSSVGVQVQVDQNVNFPMLPVIASNTTNSVLAKIFIGEVNHCSTALSQLTSFAVEQWIHSTDEYFC